MKTNEILHILRNPYGYSNEKVREIAYLAADEIERWKDAYDNLQKFAEKRGLDTATYGKEL